MNKINLLENVHCDLHPPEGAITTHLIKGNYRYFHYLCDGVDDRVPDISAIQQALVDVGDQDAEFVNSKEWIGCMEACYCLQHIYGITSKILHVRAPGELKEDAQKLKDHFDRYGSPIMMGGDRDASAKAVLGISDSGEHLLVLDPHNTDRDCTVASLQSDGWIKWVHLKELDEQSFYNLCLPQLVAK